jgi:hypothetical protein
MLCGAVVKRNSRASGGGAVLVVEKDPGRCSRFAVRWLRRLLEEDGSLTIEEASLAAAALAALGGRGHEEALSTLSPWPTERPGSRYDAGPPAYFKPEVVGEGNEAEPITPSNRAAGGVVPSLRVFPDLSRVFLSHDLEAIRRPRTFAGHAV